MKKEMPLSWQNVLHDEFKKPYFDELTQFVVSAYQTETVYPPREELFKALELTSFDSVKVVLLGQDPYHGPQQAHGLCFSVRSGIKLPPSLKNIYKELADDIDCPIYDDGFLEGWAQQGVLMLNTVLTVEDGKPNSHRKKGWETFTDAIITIISAKTSPVVFILWGNNARSKKILIQNNSHHVIESSHPSPLGAYRGFWASKPFSRTNNFLESKGIDPIDWCKR
jgi:uracil-DNA glycosylase